MDVKTTTAPRISDAIQEPLWVRWSLIAVTVVFLTLFLFVPLLAVFVEALSKGIGVYFASLTERESLAAIRMTLLTAAIVVPVNLIFGLAAAWAITKFEFRGKNFLISFIDLPFAVSPVIAGMIFVLLFGAQGWFGPWLMKHDIQIIFAVPGVILATTFVTFPFIARELIPLMQEQGTEEEQVALSLGAGGWQTFWRVTIPNIKWGLIYGIILCNARAMGEFGAVNVVSGNVIGDTNTMPVHINLLYEGNPSAAAAFALASLLVLLALVTLALKTLVEWRAAQVPKLPPQDEVANADALPQPEYQI